MGSEIALDFHAKLSNISERKEVEKFVVHVNTAPLHRIDQRMNRVHRRWSTDDEVDCALKQPNSFVGSTFCLRVVGY